MTTEETPAFGTVLKQYRMARGLTHEQLAERAGLSVRGISDLERGVRTQPRAYTVHQLADALGLPADDRAIFEAAARVETNLSPGGELSPTDAILWAPPEGEIIAREEEQERLRSGLGAVEQSAGQVVLLSGEPGIGKTRLLHEVLTQVRARGYAVLGARCAASGQHTALAPFLEALGGLAAAPPDGLRTEVQRSWKRIARMAAYLPRHDGGGGGRGAIAQQELFRAIADLLLLVARLAPVVVALDDLQWADEQSLLLLVHLARATRRAAVLLCGAFRDARVAEEHPGLAQALQALTGERLVDRLAIRRLSLEETTRLVGALMGDQPASEEFAHFVYRRTKGIPRLIEQLVRSLGGRLDLRGEIGAGAMGRVFRAFDRTTQRDVAAKLVLARSEIDLDTLLRFQQEGAVLARLDHPHIVRIHDTFAEEHASCIIMELLEGPSLGQILRDGPLSLARAKAMALQVADALSYAHSQEIVHRDIKPDNVMVLQGDQVKVTDFGIARLLQPDTSLHTIATTGMRMGTPLYMAPEQIEGKKIDGGTDIYALGAMLYHMVTGRPPFEGNDALTIAVKHVQEEPVRPSQVSPTLPADWDALILKAMAKDPARRFQSAKEVVGALAALREENGAPVRPPARRRWVAAGAGLVAVLVAAVLAVRVHAWTAAGLAPLSATMGAYLSGLAAQQQFSGSVLVARHGAVVLEKGYGLADRLYRRPNTPATTYPAFGVSDSFSVLGALQLIQQGKLTWHTPICRYLASCPPSWRPITVRRVLDGTAGLPDYTWGWPGQTTQWSLARCQGMPLGGPAAPPGSAIRYGSCTSLVLGTIIEQVSQEVWEGFLFNGTLSAVGLTNTSRLTDALAASVVARAYDSAEVAANTTYDDYYEAYATVHDIYAYDNALFGGKLLAPPYLTMLFAPRTTTMQDSGMSGITARGIGYLWQIGTAFGQRVVYTMAANRGFSLLNLRFPDAGVTIVVISNETQDDAAGIALHLAALALGRA